MFKRYGTPVKADFNALTACDKCGRRVPVSPTKVGKDVLNLCAECKKLHNEGTKGGS